MAYTIMEKLYVQMKRFDIISFIRQLFPITIWLPRYNFQTLRGDVIAGITVGIMIIPQALAFATLAGIPPQYGLYAGLTPGIVYCIFGTSKDVSMGPTVTMALFTYRYNSTYSPVGSSLLGFFVGIILIGMSILKLGFVTKFIPSHVISGFVSAAAIVIASTQLESLFGHKNTPFFFVGKIYHFFTNIQNTNPWDVSLGLLCLTFLIFFMWISTTKLNNKSTKKRTVCKNVLMKILKFVCVAKSAIVCVFGTIVAFLFHKYGYTDSFTLAGKLPKGLPKFESPLQTVILNNNQTMTTKDFTKGFGAALIILPVIQFIQAISIAKAFGKKYSYEVDSTQELLALGLANFVGCFFGGWPVCGSFSRSAVNAMSGTKTPFSGVISCTIVLLAVSFLTPVFFYIPKTALAAMIMAAVITMVDTKVPRKIWKIKRIDLIPYTISFFGTFYQLEFGVLAGAGVALIIMISSSVHPKNDIGYDINNNTVTMTLKGNITYPGVEYIKDTLSVITKKHASLTVISIDMSHVNEIDYAVLMGLKTSVSDIKSKEIHLQFINFTNVNVKMCFLKAGLASSFIENCNVPARYDECEVNAELEMADLTEALIEGGTNKNLLNEPEKEIDQGDEESERDMLVNSA